MKGIPVSDAIRWLAESGRLVGVPYVIGTPSTADLVSVCVDSRLAQAGSLFVALAGARTDGHLYVDQAVQRGAVAALISARQLDQVRRSVYGSVRLILVDDTLAALQALARAWRARFPSLCRVAITGSNGKTTTKELLSAILSRHAPTVHSRGNYNSDIGLPMELLRIRPVHRFGVFEMGMNRRGEIRLLSELADPDIALVTNIGTAHVGMLGSQEEIAREKREIFSCFSGRQTAVVPEGGPWNDLLVEGVRGTVVRHGAESAGVRSTEPLGLDGSLITLDEGTVHLRLPGAHMVSSAIAAITVARLLGVPFEQIRAGFDAMAPAFGRGEVLRGAVTVIQDCYNANPESMRAALATLDGLNHTGAKIAILGAMKELGPEAPAAHREIAELALSMDLAEVWFVGDEYAEAAYAEAAYAGAAYAEHAAGTAASPGVGRRVRLLAADAWGELTDAASSVAEGSLVLIKGSRALALERLTPVLLREPAAAGGGHE